MEKSLFKIEVEYLETVKKLEENGGEITHELEERLKINQSEISKKSIAYLEVVKSRESFIYRIDEEIKRLQELKKQQKNIIERLKGNLLEAVKIFGDFDVGFTKFGTRKSKSVIVDCNINELPDKYKIVKITESADKVAMKKAIKEGEEIKGVSVVENLNLKIS